MSWWAKMDCPGRCGSPKTINFKLRIEAYEIDDYIVFRAAVCSGFAGPGPAGRRLWRPPRIGRARRFWRSGPRCPRRRTGIENACDRCTVFRHGDVATPANLVQWQSDFKERAIDGSSGQPGPHSNGSYHNSAGVVGWGCLYRGDDL